MRHAYRTIKKDTGPITEMTIVNAFTKLIFGDEVYTTRELSIIEALQSMDDTFSCAVSRDMREEMGEYLRNLGVREMIQLVSSLRLYIADWAKAPPSSRATSTRSPQIGSPAHGRDTP